MNLCPTEIDLQRLLADRLPDEIRGHVEAHVEACPACQRQLDALTQADELNIATSYVTSDGAPAFLERLQAEYPATLLQHAPDTNGTLHFPGPASERAPLGQVGDFEIIEELGGGSFGWVFRARERSLNRIVALKVLKPEMTARSDALVRFEREARKASLKHDHIVNVYRFEKPAAFPPYLVMEYVEGETLDARLKRERALTPEAAAAIARQVALGLAAAHETGMVHRDIKPSNIMLDMATGRAKIGDFGLARDIADESMAVTCTGEVAGTAPYMSPEHFRAPGQLDGRSDVFSLGVVLYQMLTGQLPFRGSFLQIRSGILEDEPARPRRLRDTIPVDLETIALACLEKDPQRRYATAQAVAEDLLRFQKGEPILCRPTGQLERVVKWARRKPTQAALLGVGVLAVLAFAGLLIVQSFNARLQTINKDLTKTKEDLEGANAYVNRLNYVADMNLAYQAWQNDNFSLLNQLLASHETSNLRGFEWHYLRWLSNTDGQRIGPKEYVSAIAMDASGRRLAVGVSVERKAQIQVWTTPSPAQPLGELVYALEGAEHSVTELAFHPTKDWLITAHGRHGVCLWDCKLGKKLKTIAGMAPMAVSPQGTQLAYIGADGDIHRWSFADERDIGSPLHVDASESGQGSGSKAEEEPDKAKGRPMKPAAPEKPRPRDGKVRDSGFEQLAFSPDGQRLAAVGGHYKSGGFVAVWDLAGGQRQKLADAHHDDLVASVAFSPDGQTLAAAGFDHVLRVWDAKTGQLRFRRSSHKLEILSVLFNAKSTRIASAGWDKTVKVWNARTGEEVRNLRGNRGIVRQVLFVPALDKPDMENLVSLNASGELRWWDAKEEQAARVAALGEPAHSLAFSPDGKRVAAFGRSAQAFVLDLTPPGRRYDLSPMPASTHAIFNRDGKALLTLGSDGVLQEVQFEKGRMVKLVSNDKSHFAGSRVIVQKDGQYWVSPPHPSATAFAQDSVPFGKALENDQDVSAIAMDDAGERLALALPDGSIVLRRRAVDGALEESTLKPSDPQDIKALAFSPDGRHLAAGRGGHDFSILLWDTHTNTVRHHLTGHLCFVSTVAFSPDGKRLVSGSEDWTIKLWDIEVGRATLTLHGHKGRIRDLAFSPEGKYLASASEDGTLRLWPGFVDVTLQSSPRDPQADGESSKLKRGQTKVED